MPESSLIYTLNIYYLIILDNATVDLKIPEEQNHLTFFNDIFVLSHTLSSYYMLLELMQ